MMKKSLIAGFLLVLLMGIGNVKGGQETPPPPTPPNMVLYDCFTCWMDALDFYHEVFAECLMNGGSWAQCEANAKIARNAYHIRHCSPCRPRFDDDGGSQ